MSDADGEHDKPVADDELTDEGGSPAVKDDAPAVDVPTPPESVSSGGKQEIIGAARGAEAADRRTPLITALIALVGVLLGGSVAAASSYWTAKMTITAQQQQTIDQYRRDKRKDIYANLLTQLAGVERTYQQISFDVALEETRDRVPSSPPGTPSVTPRILPGRPHSPT